MELGKTAPDFAMDLVQTVTPKSTKDFPSVSPTWGSGTSESIVYAIMKACGTLNKTLAKYKAGGRTAWHDIVAAAAADHAALSASGTHYLEINGGHFSIYCSAACEAEIDVLTGEYHILRADVFYDCGVSLNPVVDIGQVEGSFVMAAGCLLSEEQVRSKVDGRLVGPGTWEYKPPQALDIPVEFNVTLVPNSVNTTKGNVLGSKASGEPAILLGAAPFFAVKDAIYAARKEAGQSGYFRLDAPATPVRVQQACLVSLGGAQQQGPQNLAQ